MADKDYKERQVQTNFFILLLIFLENSQFVQPCPESCQCQETIVTCKSNTASQLPDGLPRDTTNLKIEYNRYMAINGNLLTKLPFLTTLSLKAQFNKLEGGSFTNLQNLKTLKISNMASHKSPIDHNVFKDFVKLEELDLNGFILDSSIKDGLRFPQTLRKLRIKFCRLEEVTQVSFESLENLQHLYIQACDLKNVETFAFADLQNLLTLNLQRNKLSRINELTFSGLDNVQILVLDHNEIEFIHEDTFNSTRNLKELHLVANKLRSDPTVYMRNLDAIVRFNGRVNSWSEIKKYSLPDSLKYLDLSQTRTRAYQYDFSKMSKLKHLDLHGNPLSGLRSRELNKLTLLEYLDISYCSIRNLDFIALRNLKTLNLTNNQFFLVTNETFNKVENLETLILTKIRLYRIPDNLFESNRAMTHLALSQCQLSTLKAGTFTAMNNLERLILSGNQITRLPKDVFHNLKNLKELDLGNNKLLNSYDRCNDIGFSVGLFERCEKLEILTLRLNRLTYVNDDHLKGTRTSLLKLDVAGNSLQSIQLHSKYPNLRVIHLFGQRRSVNSTVVDISFQAVPVLKDLRLFNNKIECTCGLKKLLTKLPLNDSIDHTSDKCETPSWLKDVPLKLLAEKNPCGEGICIDDTTESSICRCPNNFYGSHCEQNQTSCNPNPCKHGACLITNGTLKCICHGNFTGKNCDVKMKCKDLLKNNDGGRVQSTILLVVFGLIVLMIFWGE